MIRKNSLITAAAIAGVLFAGTTAVAANVGLLAPSDPSSGAESSAVIQEATPPSLEPQIVDVYIEDPPVTVDTTTTVPSLSQVFAVEAAGTVSVEPMATGVLLDGVIVADGGQWTATQPSPNELQVTFTSADAPYVFSASLAPDGTIVVGDTSGRTGRRSVRAADAGVGGDGEWQHVVAEPDIVVCGANSVGRVNQLAPQTDGGG